MPFLWFEPSDRTKHEDGPQLSCGWDKRLLKVACSEHTHQLLTL